MFEEEEIKDSSEKKAVVKLGFFEDDDSLFKTPLLDKFSIIVEYKKETE